MLTLSIFPGFADTDALGHINNCVFPTWFEKARYPIFKLFTPDLDPKNWHLILAKVEIDFLAQTYYGDEVEIRTGLSKLGNSSMAIQQECWQNGVKTSVGISTMVHFDYKEQKSLPIPNEIRLELEKHLV